MITFYNKYLIRMVENTSIFVKYWLLINQSFSYEEETLL